MRSQAGTKSEEATGRGVTLLLSCLLTALVAVVFGQTIDHEFVNWDDSRYFFDDPRVREGPGWDNTVQAFSRFYFSNYHPLTTVSMMVDTGLFGDWAGGHHLMGALWHSLNSILLFLVFVRMTGDHYRSFLVAALFAVHPLHVESVAWASARKDLLYGLFWFLTVGIYHWYTQSCRAWRYLFVLAGFTAALLSKPMAVTLPVVLFLLDIWPLERYRRTSITRLIVEKLPLVSLSLLMVVVTVIAQSEGGAMRTLDEVPLTLRLLNVVTAYATYLVKTVAPVNLSYFYPMTTPGPSEILASIALIGICVWVSLRFRDSRPWVWVGFLWFAIGLLPVIGIVTVGDQAWADRYTYVPHVGLFLALVWCLPDWNPAGRTRSAALAALAGVVLGGLVAASFVQTGYWKNSESLAMRALAVDPGNFVAHDRLAEYYASRRQWDLALRHAQTVTSLAPSYSEVGVSAALTASHAYLARQQFEPATAVLTSALEIDPINATVHYNFGILKLMQEDLTSAIKYLSEAIALRPDYSEAYNNRGVALLRAGRERDAAADFRRAVSFDPTNTRARYNLAALLRSLGDAEGAAAISKDD